MRRRRRRRPGRCGARRPDGEAEIERPDRHGPEQPVGARRPLATRRRPTRPSAGVESIKKPQVGVIGGFNYISDTHLASQDYWSGRSAPRGCSRFAPLRPQGRVPAAQGGPDAQAAQRGRLEDRAGGPLELALACRAAARPLQVAKAAITQADENLRETRNATASRSSPTPRSSTPRPSGSRPTPTTTTRSTPCSRTSSGSAARRVCSEGRRKWATATALTDEVAMIAAPWGDRTMRDFGWLSDHRCGLDTGPRQSAEGGCGRNCLVLR